jgi:hypothetical protein
LLSKLPPRRPARPAGAIAWKYADPVEDARWVTDQDDYDAIAREDPGLLVTDRPGPEELKANAIQDWLEGGKKPHATGPGRPGIANDTIRIIRARSAHTIHLMVKNIINSYQVRVYQRFMDELVGHHGIKRLSPAWGYRDAVKVGLRPASPGADAAWGTPGTRVSPFPGGGEIVYDPLKIRRVSERQATDLLGRILLREE